MIRCLAMIAKPGVLGLIALACGCVADAGATAQQRCIERSAAVNDSIQHAEAGTAAAARRDYATAIRELQKAVALEPRNHAAWFALGSAYDATQRWADAVSAYEHATTHAPDDEAIYWLRRGLAVYERQLADGLDLTPAKPPLERAVGLEPSFYRGHHTLGMIAAHAQNPPAAAEAFGKAISAVPSEVESYVELGKLYLDWGYTTPAIQVLSQGDANVAAPARARVRLLLGRAYRETGDPRAIDTLTLALQDDPQLDGILFERGMAHAAAKDVAKATADLEAFGKLAPRYTNEWSLAHRTLEGLK